MSYSIQRNHLLDTIKDIFPSFSLELIHDLEAYSHYAEYQKNELIISQEQYVRALPFVLEGVIKVSRADDYGSHITLYYVNRGETCASSLQCCEAHKKSSILAEAFTDVRILLLPIQYLEELSSKHKSFKDFLLITFKDKFDKLLQTIDKIAFVSLTDRLESYLEQKFKNSNNKEISITHLQIAKDLNSTREVISRYLKRMEEDGEIRLSRGKIMRYE